MFKIYEDGKLFLKENEEIINKYPLDTSFFLLNAKLINEFSKDKYIIKFYNDDYYLLLLYLKPFNLLIFSEKINEDLVIEAVNTLIDYNLEFKSILAEPVVGKLFLEHYENKLGGKHDVKMMMDIMFIDKLVNINEKELEIVQRCSNNDLEEVINLSIDFIKEAVDENYDFESLKNKTIEQINNFYCIKENGQIITIAKKTREEEKICSISFVYTKKEFRNKGYSYLVMAKIINEIINNKKIAYLYVDKRNPVSNHLYTKLGFVYGQSKAEVHYEKTNISVLEVAGGCFWCMAKPYYDYKGVIRVLSGYTGGVVINPTYDEVKAGDTQHKEAVLIEYDNTIITTQQLLDIYFDNIDPFDEDGQFIDRGDNYTLAIFSDDIKTIEYAKKIISKLEEENHQKAAIALKPSMVFYKAEEYHQDFALKNQNAMVEELIKSGRIKNYQ